MHAALDRYYTRAEVLAFPQDGNRYELVNGELLVGPAPRALHQTIVLNLAAALVDRGGVSLRGASPHAAAAAASVRSIATTRR